MSHETHPMTLQALGLDPWLADRAAAACPEGCTLARVTAVDRGACLVRDAVREVPAEPSGRLLYGSDGPEDLPCVGDFVAVQLHSDDTAAIIHRVCPRRTFLQRKAAGRGARQQMIAANIDTAFIVQSCHFDFNPRRLERYLVMAADGGVAPVVLLTKADLASPEELDHMRGLASALTPAPAMALSSVSGAGFAELQAALLPGRTYCLLGSSGVGKTTLVNRLLGREAFATQAVSGSGEGIHTTTRRQLAVLEGGALLIDTPGMRELGLVGADAGIDAEFEAVARLSAQCRYADCSHVHEPGCAVRAAVARGELPEERYASYLKLRKESAFHEMTALDRRHKDKAFSRLVKSVKSVKKHLKT